MMPMAALINIVAMMKSGSQSHQYYKKKRVRTLNLVVIKGMHTFNALGISD